MFTVKSRSSFRVCEACGYMTVSHFFTQSFALLLNSARSFKLHWLGSRGQTRQCCIVWSSSPHSQMIGPLTGIWNWKMEPGYDSFGRGISLGLKWWISYSVSFTQLNSRALCTVGNEAQRVNKRAREDLATSYRGMDYYGMGEGVCNHLTMRAPARNGKGDVMLLIPYGLHWSQVDSNLFLYIYLLIYLFYFIFFLGGGLYNSP